jgi:Spy/CpxP family protein refolding chaperone
MKQLNYWMTQTISILALMLIPLTALAQMAGDQGGKKGMMGGGMMGGMSMQEMMGMHGMGMDMEMGGMMEMMKMMRAASRLDLTADQKKRLQSLNLQHQKEAIPLMARLRMAGVELQELLLADPVDIEKVKAKIREKHQAMAELEYSHLAVKQQTKALLTPEQRQRMESMMMKMEPMMGPSSGSNEKEPNKDGETAEKSADPHH